MSKPVKNLITDQYRDLFGSMDGAILVDIRGVDSNTTNGFRAALGKKNVKITVVKNSLAKRAFGSGKLEPLGQWVEGSNTLIYPTDEDTSIVSIARELLDWAKKIEKMQFKAAVMDGISFGPTELRKLSEYPTKEEAQAKVVTMLLSPGRNIAGAIKSPGSKIASILKTIEEKLEKGEAITKIA